MARAAGIPADKNTIGRTKSEVGSYRCVSDKSASISGRFVAVLPEFGAIGIELFALLKKEGEKIGAFCETPGLFIN
jgi:hypothetical protein